MRMLYGGWHAPDAVILIQTLNGARCNTRHTGKDVSRVSLSHSADSACFMVDSSLSLSLSLSSPSSPLLFLDKVRARV